MSMPAVRIGMQICTQHPTGDDMHQRLNDILDQVRAARDLGFTTVVAPQHFLTEPLQMYQPMPLLARVAAESGDMRLATCIVLLPLLNPVEFAEQVATLDIITGGRFAVGVGYGYRDVERDAFGLDEDERLPRYLENLELVPRLLAGETITHESEYCKLDEVQMTLRSVQQPRPPFWIGANKDGAIRRVAAVGDTWIMNPHARYETLHRQMHEVYRPELERLGKPFPADMPIRRELYCGVDRETAVREGGPWMFSKFKSYASWGHEKAFPEGEDFQGPLSDLMEDRFIIGDPGDCIRELERYHEGLGVNEFIIRVQWPGMPYEQAMANIRLIGERIVPHFV